MRVFICIGKGFLRVASVYGITTQKKTSHTSSTKNSPVSDRLRLAHALVRCVLPIGGSGVVAWGPWGIEALRAGSGMGF